MDAARLLRWIDEPVELNDSSAKELNEIIDSFPYFVGARMLHLKALQNTNSFRYNGQLKKTAAHSPDRSVLFEFITEEHIAPKALEEQQLEGQQQQQRQQQQQQQQQRQQQTEEEQANLEQVEEDTSSASDSSVEEVGEATEARSEQVRQLEDVLEEADDVSDIEGAIREEGDAEPVIGRPLKFDRSEQHSFSEWLKLTSMQPIERNEEEVDQEVKESSSDSSEAPVPEATSEDEPESEHPGPMSRQALIDRFLAESPRMSPPQKNALVKGNVAKASLDDDDSLMTETLARVYTEQGLFDKAIKAYRLLSLKYPEKSGYFADRINEINDLKERN